MCPLGCRLSSPPGTAFTVACAVPTAGGRHSSASAMLLCSKHHCILHHQTLARKENPPKDALDKTIESTDCEQIDPIQRLFRPIHSCPGYSHKSQEATQRSPTGEWTPTRRQRPTSSPKLPVKMALKTKSGGCLTHHPPHTPRSPWQPHGLSGPQVSLKHRCPGLPPPCL